MATPRVFTGDRMGARHRAECHTRRGVVSFFVYRRAASELKAPFTLSGQTPNAPTQCCDAVATNRVVSIAVPAWRRYYRSRWLTEPMPRRSGALTASYRAAATERRNSASSHAMRRGAFQRIRRVARVNSTAVDSPYGGRAHLTEWQRAASPSPTNCADNGTPSRQHVPTPVGLSQAYIFGVALCGSAGVAGSALCSGGA